MYCEIEATIYGGVRFHVLIAIVLRLQCTDVVLFAKAVQFDILQVELMCGEVLHKLPLVCG